MVKTRICSLLMFFSFTGEFPETAFTLLCGFGEDLRPCPSSPVGYRTVTMSYLFPNQSESYVHILSTKSYPSPVGVGLRRGCTLSPILFVIFTVSVSTFCRWLCSLGFISLWPAACNGAVCTRLWSSWARPWPWQGIAPFGLEASLFPKQKS